MGWGAKSKGSSCSWGPSTPQGPDASSPAFSSTDSFSIPKESALPPLLPAAGPAASPPDLHPGQRKEELRPNLARWNLLAGCALNLKVLASSQAGARVRGDSLHWLSHPVACKNGTHEAGSLSCGSRGWESLVPWGQCGSLGPQCGGTVVPPRKAFSAWLGGSVGRRGRCLN